MKQKNLDKLWDTAYYILTIGVIGIIAATGIASVYFLCCQ